jgi:RNA polymerase sigma factor (sigma-70 family)
VVVAAVITDDPTVPGPTSDRLEELYVAHAPMALRFDTSVCGDRERARDLVHDAFLRVAGHAGRLRTPDRFDVYLRRTIVNLHTSRLRRLRLEREHLARERRAVANMDREVDVAGRFDTWNAVCALPPRQRTAIVLRYYEQLEYAEIADLTGVREGSVRSRVSRGLAALRATMPPSLGENDE